ncbi:endo-1,4-beta-xylanase [Cellvibrio sp. OA-2007]|uniref:endo-1,4-beta-xylanase n=1 Tax=Cellvibrio sp. OA-2007 TaxID=529823 RepID=UPI000782F97E|nr:endo-1,4-beta-xylanase [Cellvibrio sp. OA-2007]
MQTSQYPVNPLARILKRTCSMVGASAALAVLSHSAFAVCTYTVESEWNTGFVASITIKNDTAAPINNWSVNWGYANNRITGTWNANFAGSNPYTASNVSWNGNIPVGQSVSFGFQGNKNSATAERPTVNGAACGGAVASSAAPSSAPRSSVAPSSVPRSSAAPSSQPVISTSSSSSSAGYTVPTNNFAQNGGVENGLTNWSTTAGTVTRSTQDKRSGSASALISGRTANWHGLTFNVGSLVSGSQYDVAVWVKLAPGTPDSVVQLTAKRQDDNDSSTYNEYTQVATATASSTEWRLVQGYYTQSGATAFQHFIIEATDATISFYADDFSIGGQAPVVNSSSSRSSSSAPAAKKFIGNITTSGAVRSDFNRYWNQITGENEGKWGSVEGTRDVYNWAPVDRIYAYARANNIPVKAHTFVWGAQSPSWINNLSASETAAEIEEWIRDYCARYPDTAMIDVVNEAVYGHQPAAYAQKAFGNNWIQRVFQLARQYCPNSILILNDYNNIRWQHNEFIALAKPLAQGGYIDAVGLQSHELKGMTAAQVKTAIDNIWNQLQVPIYISEYDIGDTNDQVQLQNFQAHFPVFWDHPHVKGITIWGYINGRTWIEGSGLMSDNGTPRPAMTWLLNNYINK